MLSAPSSRSTIVVTLPWRYLLPIMGLLVMTILSLPAIQKLAYKSIKTHHFLHSTSPPMKDHDNPPPPPRSCIWNESLNECRALLSPALQQKPMWIFMGDSTMQRLFEFFGQLWPHERKHLKTDLHRCYHQPYYGFDRP